MLHFCDNENYRPRIKWSLSSANFVILSSTKQVMALLWFHMQKISVSDPLWANAALYSVHTRAHPQGLSGCGVRLPCTSIHCWGQEWVELFTSTTLYAFAVCIGKTPPFTCQRGLYVLHCTLLKDRKLQWICKIYFCCETYLLIYHVVNNPLRNDVSKCLNNPCIWFQK
jgi:hypothetical protein